MALDATLRGEKPPNPSAPPSWATESREWRVRIVLDRAALPSEALSDPQFWYVGVHGAEGTEIYRQDDFGDELRQLLDGDVPKIVIERRFSSDRQPVTWTVWPTGAVSNWLTKSTGAVDGAAHRSS
jgi:hypothetical protein